MPRDRSSRDRLTEATLSGLAQNLVTNNVPEPEAIAQIHAESTDTQLLSRVAGHLAARAVDDPGMAERFNAAAALVVRAGGTDADTGRAARDQALAFGQQRPPDAWRTTAPRD